MATKLPHITGMQLFRLLKRGGFVDGRKARHGRSMTKRLPGGTTVVTFVPETRSILPLGALQAILGSKQTKIGRSGFLKLIEEHGI
jgi:predicted RNA binding protein YcfA (HicA-like mRNA interferase family)